MDVRVVLVAGLLVTAVVGPVTASQAGPGVSEPTAAGADCAFPYETTDVTGTEVRLDEEPERVVTLNPSAAQTMWEVGAGEKVVGLTKYASYLEGARTRANVSSAGEIVVVERVVELEPDLVLAPNATSRETVEQLRNLGLTVYHFPRPGDLEGVVEKTRTIGRLTGACAGAESTVERMRDRIGTVERAVAGRERPDVLYAFFGYTAGQGTFIHNVIETAGGNNVAAEFGVVGYRQLNPEVVVEADPDWIVRTSNDPETPEGAPFNRTTAVREGQIVVLPVQLLDQPAPRVERGVTRLAEHFHPGALPANGTETATGTAETGQRTPTTTATAATTTGTSGQSGFGVVSGSLALFVASLALRGRR